MCKFKTLGVPWPPKGWEQLSIIKKTGAQTIHKDPVSAVVTGLSYTIDPCPHLLGPNHRRFSYQFSLMEWNYNIYNESGEYPVLSFTLWDRPEKGPKHYYMSDIRTQARPLALTHRSAQRTYMAALFLMKQINSDIVPDTERLLRLYKIHPSQRSLYEIDNERQDSLFCGLVGAGFKGDDRENA